MSIKTRKTWLAVGCTILLASGAPGFVAPSMITSAYAQTKKITGTVVDEFGDPIIGANIRVKGTNNGAVTDMNGKFSVDAKPGAQLEVSFIGYATQTVAASEDIKVALKEDSQSLDDVIVVGYGVQKKKLVTGATVQVKGDDIAKLNTTNALEAMQSSTPGVQITQSSSQPGKGFSVTIRGKGTIGNSSPLYVIDGVPGGSLDGINPADIESIDVLKDAASSAIYGARGANGVILVTTKQGKAGKIELTYNGSMGWANVYKRPQMLNAQQFMTIMDEYTFNTSGAKFDFSTVVPQSILDKVADGWEGTDWWGAFENENAQQQNHSITLTGGSDKSKFAMSYSYTDNEGIMGADRASYYKRHTIRVNSDHVLLRVKDFDAITIGENININYSINHDLAEGGMYWSYIHSLLQTNPLVPMYADNGELYYHTNPETGEKAYGEGWNDYWFNNPYEGLEKGGFGSMAESRSIGANATAFITIQPIKGLKWRTQFNYAWNAGGYRSYSEPRSPSSGSGTVSSYSVSQSTWLSSNYSVENTLTYDLPIIAGNKISVMAGQSFQSTSWSTNLSGSNSVNIGSQYATLKGWDSAYLANFSTDLSVATLSGNPNDDEYLASWFGRVNWDYNEKYMATLTARYDGSSIFNKGNRWGFFPSASAGWVVSNEDFMESTKDYMDFLKVRASWGQNGNNSISKYQYLATIAQSSSAGDSGYKFSDDMSTTLTGKPNTGAYADIVPNPDVTWETSEQLDLGIDARFLDSRLGVNFDWYKKTTKDWLILGPRIAIQGTNPAYINGGDVENSGFELALSWNDKIGDLRYNVGVNVATNKNEVTRIANENGYINGTGGVLSQGTEYIYRAEIGKPIGYFYGMSYSGIWQNQAQIDEARAAGKAVLDNAQPGDCIWDDFNGDGLITYAEGDNCDRHEIGNPNPDVTLGVNLGLNWKGLDFSINGAGAFGMQIMRSYRSFGDSWWHNYDSTILNRWHGEGTSNEQPRISGTGHNNTIWVSNRYMEDADYFKIKAVTLGYDFKQLFKKLPLQQCRLYVQAQNLYTFTGYTGLDPEVGNSGGADSWASGIDLGLYPPSRTYLVGVNIKF